MAIVRKQKSHNANRTRIVVDLQWARESTGEYFTLGKEGKKALTPSQKSGLRFEKKVGLLLGKEKDLLNAAWNPQGRVELFSGQWYEFKDKNGLGIAQPDHLLLCWGGGTLTILIVECKLTWTKSAWGQLGKLYLPLLKKRWEHVGPTILGVQCCKRLTPEGGKGPAVYSWEEALRGKDNSLSTLHLPFV